MVMTDKRIGDFMQTYTGRSFYPLDPRAEEISLEDIAHSLSNQCRFAGHCKSFYSVAQHSVLVADNVPESDKKWALLHDATEAFLVDLPRPVKYHSAIGVAYREAEDALTKVICERFGLPLVPPPSVKQADNDVLLAERRDLMQEQRVKWTIGMDGKSKAVPQIIVPWSPSLSKKAFLGAAHLLGIK